MSTLMPPKEVDEQTRRDNRPTDAICYRDYQVNRVRFWPKADINVGAPRLAPTVATGLSKAGGNDGLRE